MKDNWKYNTKVVKYNTKVVYVVLEKEIKQEITKVSKSFLQIKNCLPW